MDDSVTSYEMFEELEYIHDEEKYDNETLDKVLMALTNYNFEEIKEMVKKRVEAAANE